MSFAFKCGEAFPASPRVATLSDTRVIFAVRPEGRFVTETFDPTVSVGAQISVVIVSVSTFAIVPLLLALSVNTALSYEIDAEPVSTKSIVPVAFDASVTFAISGVPVSAPSSHVMVRFATSEALV
jgi:hypothetical protein